MSEDLEMWRELKADIESWPAEPGKYGVRFNGEPEEFDEVLECGDCHQRVHFRGVSFGPYDRGLSLSQHHSRDCPAWRNRLWRLTHHHGPLIWWARWRYRPR